MKVRIESVAHEYPGIVGDHEFESLEKAIDFARYGAKGIHPEEGDQLIIDFSPLNTEGIDVKITIYDGYVE